MNKYPRLLMAMMLSASLFTACDEPIIVPGNGQETETPEAPDTTDIPNPPAPLEQNIQAGANGAIEFTLASPDTTTVISSASPLTMTISQTSSYTDPDSTVYVCTPKAEIVLAISTDTVFAQNLQALTAVADNADITTAESGDNPVTHSTRQTFTIGGQTIDFDLAYEVYTYVNSLKQHVAMPYIKLGEVALGNATSDATRAAGAVRLANVAVKPLGSTTRTIEVTDTALYEVTARFTLEAEVANLPEATKQTIPFEVVYVGAVATTNIYPGAEFSYQLTDAEGNATEDTHFTIHPNSTFTLAIKQISSYTDQHGAASATPMAWTKIVTPDVLTIQKPEELAEKLADVTIEVENEELEGRLPYYKLGEVVLDGEVAVAEQSASEDGKTQVYKATATYKQKATPVNFEDGAELEFIYVVEYLGEVNVELVDVEYVQEVIWEDKHDNIPTNSQIVVTRKAKYSDGTVNETKFYSAKNSVQPVCAYTQQDESGEIEYVNYGMGQTVNSFISICATGVPDLEHFDYDVCVGDNEFVNLNDYTDNSFYTYLVDYEGPEGVWTEYKHQETKELYSEAVQTEGLYGKQFGFRSFIVGRYLTDTKYLPIRQYNIDLIYKDRFFCIDGKLFTCEPLEHSHRWSVEKIESPSRGTCALHKLEADVTWFGRDFYYAVIDTVYVKQPSSATATPQRSPRLNRAKEPHNPAMTLTMETVPGSVPYTEHTIIRPDGTRTTVRREGIVSDWPVR